MTRAAELARKSGWPEDKWRDGEPVLSAEPIAELLQWLPGSGGLCLDPENVTDHALALAECRWSSAQYDIKLERVGPRWYCFAKRKHPTMNGPNVWQGDAVKSAPKAICAALDAAGEKD